MTMRHRVMKDAAKGYGIIGKRFGELVVLRPSRSGRAGAWVAQCDCGKLALVYDYLLKSGPTTSCGCERSVDELTHPDSRPAPPRLRETIIS
jgi:hypothetical protein